MPRRFRVADGRWVNYMNCNEIRSKALLRFESSIGTFLFYNPGRTMRKWAIKKLYNCKVYSYKLTMKLQNLLLKL